MLPFDAKIRKSIKHFRIFDIYCRERGKRERERDTEREKSILYALRRLNNSAQSPKELFKLSPSPISRYFLVEALCIVHSLQAARQSPYRTWIGKLHGFNEAKTHNDRVSVVE